MPSSCTSLCSRIHGALPKQYALCRVSVTFDCEFGIQAPGGYQQQNTYSQPAAYQQPAQGYQQPAAGSYNYQSPAPAQTQSYTPTTNYTQQYTGANQAATSYSAPMASTGYSAGLSPRPSPLILSLSTPEPTHSSVSSAEFFSIALPKA